MWENLMWFILGLIANFVVGVNLWNTKFMKGLQARREQERISKILSQSHSALIVNSLRIEQIMAQVFETPLEVNDIVCSFDPQSRTLPEGLQDLELSYLPKRIALLRRQGRTVDDNALYGLKSISIERPQIEGKRRNRPNLVFEPTFYRYYLMCNESLDDPLLQEPDGDLVSIRQRHNIYLQDFQWSDVQKIPLHQHFATTTAVVTADDQLVIPIRSQMQATAIQSRGDTWHSASLSCAEGMERSADSSTPLPVETPSPFMTVFRALYRELGINRGDHYLESHVKLLSMAYDKKRCQPLGVFFLKLEKLSFADIFNETYPNAPDRHENMTLIPIACETKSIANLLLGKTLHTDGKPVRMFSNHQQIGTLLVGFHLFGVKSFTDALKD